MKKSKLIFCLASLGISAAFVACGDSTSASSEDLSSSSVQENPESSSSVGKYSSSVAATESSSSEKTSATSSSSENIESSSSSEESSSSGIKAFITPTDSVVEKCSVSGSCDKMDRDDVSTWHFVRKDNFGDNMEYIYTVDGETLILTTIDKDGVRKVDETSYSFYDMTKEASRQMAFSAIKSTCVDGGGNDIGDMFCTKDSIKTLPECDASLEGEIAVGFSKYYVCESGEWRDAGRTLYDTYGSVCADSTINKVIEGRVTSNIYYCSEEGWNSVGQELYWDVPKEARFNPDIDYDTIIDSRDQKVYRIVSIGNQTWMAENLNYADSVNTPSLKGSSWCYLNEDVACELFGRLYTWAAAVDSVALANDSENPQTCGMDTSCTLPDGVRGICPEGWRLPKKYELEDLAGGLAPMRAGKWLKTRTGWGNSKGGDDSYGFSALPVGLRNSDGKFALMEERAVFWSATSYGRDEVQVFALYDYTEQGSFGVSSKNSGLPIRCIKVRSEE